MSARTEPTVTLWACTDCLFLQVNGELPTEMSEEQAEEWLANIDLLAEGVDHYTPGCDHNDCDHDDGDERTACETQEFSWSRCDLCGSKLGGSRHAFVGWIAT